MNRTERVLEVQERYRSDGALLNERQRRHWAAAEAIRLGRGGIAIVSEALRMSPNTIKRGLLELTSGETRSLSDGRVRIRQAGGGRKPKAGGNV